MSQKRQSPELRKTNKPLMEKRRRARINKSLNELKSILMESMEQSSLGHSKWEKADILEMTVQYLRRHKNRKNTLSCDPLAIGQFIAGYSECLREIQKFYILRNVDSSFSGDVTDHLLAYLKAFSHDSTITYRNNSFDKSSIMSFELGSDSHSTSSGSKDDDFDDGQNWLMDTVSRDINNNSNDANEFWRPW